MLEKIQVMMLVSLAVGSY